MTDLTNLEEFTKYEIMITVSTRIGSSSPSIVTVVTDPDSAGPPSFIDAMTINSTAIEVMWGFPSDPQGIIQGYIITYRVDDVSNEMTQNVTLDTPNDMSNQTYVIDMLRPFTDYHFRVSAYAFSDGDDPFQLHLGEDTGEIGPIRSGEAGIVEIFWVGIYTCTLTIIHISLTSFFSFLPMQLLHSHLASSWRVYQTSLTNS